MPLVMWCHLANHTISWSFGKSWAYMYFIFEPFSSFGYLWKLVPPHGLKYSLFNQFMIVINLGGLNHMLILYIWISVSCLWFVPYLPRDNRMSSHRSDPGDPVTMAPPLLVLRRDISVVGTSTAVLLPGGCRLCSVAVAAVDQWLTQLCWLCTEDANGEIIKIPFYRQGPNKTTFYFIPPTWPGAVFKTERLLPWLCNTTQNLLKIANQV